jgi:hypothetical protein
VPLDLTSAKSVSELAGEVGRQGRHRHQQRRGAPQLRHRRAPRRDAARAEMDINYFGLLRLAQEFGPALERGAAPTAPPARWPG